MSDTPGSSDPSSRRSFGPYAVIALLGFALVVTARIPHPGGRTGRARLIDLIAEENAHSQSLRRQVDVLQAKLAALQVAAPRDEQLRGLEQRVDRLGRLAGLSGLAGPGVEVVLKDSTLRRAPSGDPNDLVIHEQDIQAIVNALWVGGAEAMSINGERITSTSAVRCVGNTLLLHGSVYAPPYRIDAIGDAAALRRGLNRDPQTQRFAAIANDLRLGFIVRASVNLIVGPYRGAL